MAESEGRIIFFVLDPEGKPYQVIALSGRWGTEEYEVDYSKAQDCLYFTGVGSAPLDDGGMYGIELSEWSNGAKAKYWCDDAVIRILNPECGERLSEFPEGYNPTTFFDDHEEAVCIYCSVCDDYLPTGFGNPCGHVLWDESSGWWAGCGYEDRQPKEYKEDFFKLLDMGLDVAGLERQLEPWRHGHGVCTDDLLPDLSEEQEEEALSAILWLESLEVGVTLAAEKITLGWIEEWRLKQ